MNILGNKENSHVELELKYCERCGGLFLRAPASGLVYCANCSFQLAAEPEAREFFTSHPRRRRSRAPRLLHGPRLREGEIQGAMHIECLQGVAALEVRV